MDIVEGFEKVTKEFDALDGETYAKRYQFEAYALGLFSATDFKLLHATTRRENFDGRIVESVKNPDFHFQHKRSEDKFWVECAWRPDFLYGKLPWCKDYQLKRYKEFQEEIRPEVVYALIGFGGKASKPQRLFCIPLDEIESSRLDPTILNNFERAPALSFLYAYGRLV
jgi:hypothetical protein